MFKPCRELRRDPCASERLPMSVLMRRSGRARGSNMTPPPPPSPLFIRAVPSRWRSFMWFKFTAYWIVPDEADRIFRIGCCCEPLTFAYSTRIMDESTPNGMCTRPERWVGCEYRTVTIFSNAAVIFVALAMNGRLRFVGLEEGAVSISSCADSGAGVFA